MKFNKSMVEYVKYYTELDEIDLEIQSYSVVKELSKIANFLSQKLELYMIIACDENGNFLEEPNKTYYLHSQFAYEKALEEYQTALSKVIFEGCGLMDDWCLQFPDGTLFCNIEELHKYTIEDLIPYNLDIKESVAQELGLI